MPARSVSDPRDAEVRLDGELIGPDTLKIHHDATVLVLGNATRLDLEIAPKLPEVLVWQF